MCVGWKLLKMGNELQGVKDWGSSSVLKQLKTEVNSGGEGGGQNLPPGIVSIIVSN